MPFEGTSDSAVEPSRLSGPVAMTLFAVLAVVWIGSCSGGRNTGAQSADQEGADALDGSVPWDGYMTGDGSAPTDGPTSTDGPAFDRRCMEYYRDVHVPCTQPAPECGPFPPQGTSVGTTNDGGFVLTHAIGTGNFICDYQVFPGDAGSGDVWIPVRGPDFGAIDNAGTISSVISIDGDYVSDGQLYLGANALDDHRSFARERGLPCQMEGVTLIHAVATFGQPAMTASGLYEFAPYRAYPRDDMMDISAAGNAGIYYYHRETDALVIVLDNRDPREPHSLPVESYVAGKNGIVYSCKDYHEVPADGCAVARTCNWKRFDVFGSGNGKEEYVFRGMYETPIGQRTSIFRVLRDDDFSGSPFSFTVEAVVDTGKRYFIGDEVTPVKFDWVSKAWTNDQRHVVFVGGYNTPMGSPVQGVYFLNEGAGDRLVEVARDGEMLGYTIENFDPNLLGVELQDVAALPDDADAGTGPDPGRNNGLNVRATSDVLLNDKDGVGHVLFHASFRVGPKKYRGVFIASPVLDGNGAVASYGVVNIARNGRFQPDSENPGLEYEIESFDGFSFNKNNQAMFKALGVDGSEVLFFYDGAAERPKTHPLLLTKENMPENCAGPFWYVTGNYALNDDARFMFRAACLSGEDKMASWAVMKAVFNR